MRVAIITPAYNAAETITETIKSVQTQTYNDWELIIVDDGSVDKTRTIVEEFIKTDERIRLIAGSHCGVSAARNLGMDNSKSEFILFLDADDIILPEHLHSLTSEFSKDPSLDAVYCNWARLAPSGEIIHEAILKKTGELFDVFARNCALSIHSILCRSSLVKETGGFDQSLVTCEDWDLWQRISRTGAKFGSVQKTLSLYRMRSDSASGNSFQMVKDTITVVTRGHDVDPRVKNPKVEYKYGLSKDKLAFTLYHSTIWSASLALGRGQNAAELIKQIENINAPDIDPRGVADTIYRAAILPGCRLPQDWLCMYEKIEENINQLFEQIEIQSKAPGFKVRALRSLNSQILASYNFYDTAQIGNTFASRIELCDSIQDIYTQSSVDRFIGNVFFEGEFISQIHLPAFKGRIQKELIKEKVVNSSAWKILGKYFARHIYPSLEITQENNRICVKRKDIKSVNTYLVTDNVSGLSLHDKIGWTIFLQELWGLKNLHSYQFYDESANITPEVTIKVADILHFEIGSLLPEIVTSYKKIKVIISVGGEVLGNIIVPSDNGKITPAKLISEVNTTCGFSLCKAFVKKAIIENIGETILSFRERLLKSFNKNFSNLNGKKDLETTSYYDEKQDLNYSEMAGLGLTSILPPSYFILTSNNNNTTNQKDGINYWSSELPILMYHRVAPRGTSALQRYRISPENFEEQIKYLYENNFKTITLEHWREAMFRKRPLNGKYVLLTFDDGYADFYEYAFPVLKKYNFTAMVFLVTNYIGKYNKWDHFYGEEIPLMSWENIIELNKFGIEFGSHSHNHFMMNSLNNEEITREAITSKKIIEKELGSEIITFCFPYGDEDPVVQHLISACGYYFGLTTRPGISHFNSSLLCLPRVEIMGTDSLIKFKKKICKE